MTILTFIALMSFSAQANSVNEITEARHAACKVMNDVLQKALVEKKTMAEEMALSEIPNVLTVLKQNQPPSAAEMKALDEKYKNVSTFKEAAEATQVKQGSLCLSERLQVMRALISNFRNPKLDPKLKKEMRETIRAEWKGEINSLDVGIMINSGFMLQACERRLDKDLGIKCEGLKEFRDHLRNQTRLLRKNYNRASDEFTFLGRFLWYWDKWVAKKDLRKVKNDPVLADRYFKFAPVKKIIEEEQKNLGANRAEFEKFIL